MRVLRREMGVEPGSATKELFERILQGNLGAPGELTSASSSSSVPQPFSLLQKVHSMAGRTTEWDLLAQAWQAAVENGPRVAVISGEPGIGKTRLGD